MPNDTKALHQAAEKLSGELDKLSPDTLHYLRHGIASQDELAIVASICEHSEKLVELLTQIGNKPQ
ncbi:hypothetical protein C1N32_20765 [Vibrio diazotrophicus]|uniref:EscE/YscE/SsaE family type III secretion system needle protein co-chaperone n=1 Tax=Vibrio diazotrophicus TaxID=685 RepID=A0A2J8HSF3_VIBDI|nr:hypothetical protein [Vibrio diazotrophicus]PNI01198.1 hypothetical protein C1N32_20765 [Vibrio diazotrophicus]